MKKTFLFISFLCVSILNAQNVPQKQTKTWMPDNGNGTFTNPLFYDEFSDPDMIRVGDDFYLTGTTMHTVPGLPVMKSKDLVNWELLGYVFNKFTLGPEFNLEQDKEAYGQGIWAPCIRYHNSTFYIFSNVNGHGMQVFSAKDPKGPWEHRPLNSEIYDLSVLFDDDGKIYAVYNYNEVHLVQLKPDFSGTVEGTDRIVIPAGNNMGEGHHMYKINGKYYIISANYAPVGRMQCARSDSPYGPYETVVISAEETMGTQRGWLTQNAGFGKLPEAGAALGLSPPGDNYLGAVTLHQGGIVDLPNGDWWGFSMMDFRSVGRTTCISPVTWKDGWPYFGLEGNPGRSPRTWTKPNVAAHPEPTVPYHRCDDFSGPVLANVWQWNHNPADDYWELNKKKGSLRLHTLPARDFMWARNTLTQRGIGPASTATTRLDASSLKPGDYAGIAILNLPYATLGIQKKEGFVILRFYDQEKNRTIEIELPGSTISLRITGDFDNDFARFSYSTDDLNFNDIGDPVCMSYQLKTFQGSRYALFAYNTENREGGYADFLDFKIDEPLADRSANIPLGKVITLTNLADSSRVWANPHGMLHSQQKGSKEFSGPGCLFRVHNRGNGKVALEAMNGTGFVTVVGTGISADVRLVKNESEASLFMWQDMLYSQLMLLSLKTNRYAGLTPGTGEPYAADRPGALPNRKNGTVLVWQSAE